jgi:hypothetical protein
MKTDEKTLPDLAARVKMMREKHVEAKRNESRPFELCPEITESEGGFPHVQATHSLNRITQYITKDTLTARNIADVLHRAKHMDGDGESALFYQSQVLDALFHRVSTQALRDHYVDKNQFDLALRLQKQCRSAIESMAFLKHMKSIKNRF